MKIFLYLISIFQFESIFSSTVPINNEINDLKEREKRLALSDPKQLWPSNVIHYKISCTEYTKEQVEIIKTSFDEIMNKTCLEISEIDDSSDQNDFIDIHCNEGGGTKSVVGYAGNAQHLNLEIFKHNHSCLTRHKVQHEFLHALGFMHEHVNPNRDDYLKVDYDNIKPTRFKYFIKTIPRKSSSYGCEFDYNSVMMPRAYEGSRNGLPTLIPKDETHTSDTIGIAEGVSDCDIIRINNIYCSELKENEQI